MDTLNTKGKGKLAAGILFGVALFLTLIKTFFNLFSYNKYYGFQLLNVNMSAVFFRFVEIATYALLFVYATFFYKKKKVTVLLPIGILLVAFYNLACVIEAVYYFTMPYGYADATLIIEAMFLYLPIMIFAILAGVDAFKGFKKRGFVVTIAVLQFVIAFKWFINSIEIFSEYMSFRGEQYMYNGLGRVLIFYLLNLITYVVFGVALLLFSSKADVPSIAKSGQKQEVIPQEAQPQVVPVVEQVVAVQPQEAQPQVEEAPVQEVIETAVEETPIEEAVEEVKEEPTAVEEAIVEEEPAVVVEPAETPVEEPKAVEEELVEEPKAEEAREEKEELANFCIMCGNKFEDGQKFCQYCGHKR
ncbi:MAG: hypothetical protein IJC07_00995 [Clostridia bacterium]|nr:hypothetical protein [Clostridia bacterium]